MDSKYHHKFDVENAEPSNPCPFCSDGDLVLTNVSPSQGCKLCLGTGWYNQFSGGGTDPVTPGVPPVYGLRMDRMVCNKCTTVSLTCDKCENTLTGPIVHKDPPLPRKTHADAMALVPKEWLVLTSEDSNQSSSLRFAEYNPASGSVGFGHAEFWREPDISEFGEKSPYPIRNETWAVDPESGFGLSREETEKVLRLFDAKDTDAS